MTPEELIEKVGETGSEIIGLLKDGSPADPHEAAQFFISTLGMVIGFAASITPEPAKFALSVLMVCGQSVLAAPQPQEGEHGAH